MKIYNFYLFDRRGKCLFYREWNRENSSTNVEDSEKQMLVFGLLFSLKQLVQKLSPKQASLGTNNEGVSPTNLISFDDPGNLFSFSSDISTLHQFETKSGLRFVLNSERCNDSVLADIRKALRHVYSDIYVNFVVSNPLYLPGTSIAVPAFEAQLDTYILSLANKL